MNGISTSEMIEMNKEIVKSIKKDIKKEKKKLIKKALKKGLYENFGQIEVRRLEDKYADYRYKSEFGLIREFNEFLMNFDERGLR